MKIKPLVIIGTLFVMLLTINYKVVPYCAFIHTTAALDASYFSELLRTPGKLAVIRLVDKIYVGWSFFLMFIVPMIVAFIGIGFHFGFKAGADGKQREVKLEVQKILSEKKVSTSGVIIQGFRAEDIEYTLKMEYRKFEKERREFECERILFDEERAQFDEQKNSKPISVNNLDKLKHEQAKRYFSQQVKFIGEPGE
jgi:hypothetical protein